MGKNIPTAVEKLVAPVVESKNMELVDVNYIKEGGRWFLRLFIDKPEGVDLDDCELISQSVEPVLDSNDPISGPYTLEVSSPGLDRPLRKVADYERFQGYAVNISTFAPVNGQRRFKGVLKGVLEDEIKLSVDKSDVYIPLDQVAKAKLAPEFQGLGG
ncbi:MAG: ribosome maturation factor RimP [Clostridiales bacterium]|nr:ribosome maturation factor RimP [Clostridiales bacterium]MCF8022177.1 ribosome maturation factor RimP [Clostridiales bacterium]